VYQTRRSADQIIAHAQSSSRPRPRIADELIPGMSRFKGSALATGAVFRYDARVQCVRATAAAAGGSIHQSTARGR